MKSKAKRKKELEDYIKAIKTYNGKDEDFDWQVYVDHKKVVDSLCYGDIEMYSWAMEEISDKLKI